VTSKNSKSHINAADNVLDNTTKLPRNLLFTSPHNLFINSNTPLDITKINKKFNPHSFPSLFFLPIPSLLITISLITYSFTIPCQLAFLLLFPTPETDLILKTMWREGGQFLGLKFLNNIGELAGVIFSLATNIHLKCRSNSPQNTPECTKNNLSISFKCASAIVAG